MTFSSMIFVLLFLTVQMVALRFAATIKQRNVVLLVFSLIFYAFGGPQYLPLLCGMVLISYVGALAVERAESKSGRKLALILTCTLLLGILGFFKYLTFLLENLNLLTGWPNVIPAIALPIGISFYTFQLLSYVVDVYRWETPAQKKYHLLLLYAGLFHQCIAGPIVRYSDIAYELLHRKMRSAEVSEGILRFSIGLAKKAVLANTCASLADEWLPIGDKLSEIPATGLLLGGVCYMLQIYLDFSAYSDMAIGMGLISGFHYKENFNYPYAAISITDFWRRWHISLSSFFRDYVYIPLGGSRVSRGRHIFNLFAVWALTGFWHGASWNFLLWGLYYFAFLMIEKFLLHWTGKEQPSLLSRLLRRVYVLPVLFFGWLLFRFDDLHQLWIVLKGLVCANGNAFSSPAVSLALSSHAYFLLFAVIACAPLYKKAMDRLSESRVKIAVLLYNGWLVICPILMLVLSMLALVGDSYNPFLYFRF
ncbi:MAG: MBOAT family protein [Clostridia bacterium]|nr:MBOAT family protein [Clostridia bacterium]